MQYVMKYRDGHVEVYSKSGIFLFSADTQTEARFMLERCNCEEFQAASGL